MNGSFGNNGFILTSATCQCNAVHISLLIKFALVFLYGLYAGNVTSSGWQDCVLNNLIWKDKDRCCGILCIVLVLCDYRYLCLVSLMFYDSVV